MYMDFNNLKVLDMVITFEYNIDREERIHA